MKSVSSKIITMVGDDGLPVVSLQRYNQINNKFFSVLFSSIEDNSAEVSFDRYNEAIAAMSDYKLAIEPDSLFVTARKPHYLLRCILSANSETKPYNEENIKGMIPIQANVFQDGEVIWKLVGQGDDRQLIQVTKEDYKTILDARRSRSTMLASESSYVTEYKDGDYAYFLNHEIEAMDFGIVVTTKTNDFIVSRTTKKAVKVNPNQVLEAAENKDNPTVKRREMAASNEPITSYLEYIGMLYGKNNEFYRALERAIKESSHRIR